MNQSVNDKALCRTALATPGLLNICRPGKRYHLTTKGRVKIVGILGKCKPNFTLFLLNHLLSCDIAIFRAFLNICRHYGKGLMTVLTVSSSNLNPVYERHLIS